MLQNPFLPLPHVEVLECLLRPIVQAIHPQVYMWPGILWPKPFCKQCASPDLFALHWLDGSVLKIQTHTLEFLK